ncbi:hypothetical protein CC1G_03605 [Coprinopsis cinerea okayama7|uniref:Uncharacterized protein n=1 Tax=Coprinopsis cinerea (strain Okayama-7 / 130 / ATCC MYA-4618 / FGSC 9003) TaxID=240176 RepID=A8NCP7_COPC7|nr:hypothetical protein CC1G_03605 [Coprinopsis cinerea okayama7\|eukprot:XP_001832591.1 hypothetical protein CC1G_03605 [Coprinopsis cinerea okayama7\
MASETSFSESKFPRYKIVPLPYPKGKQALEALIARSSASLSTLEKRKKWLLQELESVKVDINLVNSDITNLRYATKTTLIQEFPVELLSRIFTMACEGQTLALCGAKGNKRHRTATAVVLSKVCKQWNAIAKRCPLLWNKVGISCIERSLGSRSRRDPFLDVVRTTLQRSNPVPLYLGFYNNVQRDIEDLIWLKFWTTILEFRHRFATFHLDRTELGPIGSIDTSPLPNQALQLTNVKTVSSPPNLLPVVPLNALTHLTIFVSDSYDMSPESLVTILRSAPLLEVLRLNFGEHGLQESESKLPPVDLPRLRVLELQHWFIDAYDGTLLPLLSTPSLERLDIVDAWNSPAPDSDDNLFSFISPKRVPNLREFRVGYGNPIYLGRVEGVGDELEYFAYIKSSDHRQWKRWTEKMFTFYDSDGDFEEFEHHSIRHHRIWGQGWSVFTEVKRPAKEYGRDEWGEVCFVEDQIGEIVSNDPRKRDVIPLNTGWGNLKTEELANLEDWFEVMCHKHLRKVERTLALAL